MTSPYIWGENSQDKLTTLACAGGEP